MTTFHHYEDETTEFKKQLTDSLEKEIVAFLNSDKGGDIYIGVEDDGTVVGVENRDGLQRAIIDRIKNNILPTTLGFFDVVTQELQGKPVVHIIVTRGTEKPYYLKKYGLSPAGAHIRVGTGTQQLTTDMIDRLYASRTRNSLRNIPSPRGKLGFNQLKIYYDEKGFTVNDAFLENLDLYTHNGTLNYVAYLLADQNSVSIKVAKYAGTDKVDLIENGEYGLCSLIKATNQVLDKLEVENRTFTKITGDAQRLQKRMIDRRALREALINAMVHNDYTQEAPPVVEIYSDRLSITSCGGLVTGLSLDEFLIGRSMPRNRELMRVYKDLDFVEQLGSGMSRIFAAYAEDVFKISNNFLEVCFPFGEGYLDSLKEDVLGETPDETSGKRRESVGKASEKTSEKTSEKASEKTSEKASEKTSEKTSEKIISLIKRNSKITIEQLSEDTGVTARSIERNLKKLQEDNKVKRVGSAKGGYWEVVDE